MPHTSISVKNYGILWGPGSILRTLPLQQTLNKKRNESPWILCLSLVGLFIGSVLVITRALVLLLHSDRMSLADALTECSRGPIAPGSMLHYSFYGDCIVRTRLVIPIACDRDLRVHPEGSSAPVGQLPLIGMRGYGLRRAAPQQDIRLQMPIPILLLPAEVFRTLFPFLQGHAEAFRMLFPF
jgi:hypothetical protein